MSKRTLFDESILYFITTVKCMDKNKIRKILEENGYQITLEKRYRKYAWRFKLSIGSSVYCGDTGSCWAQGKQKRLLEDLINYLYVPEKNNKVFVVYGHDENAKNELIELLHLWNIEPVLISDQPYEGRTIIEQLEKYIPQANYGIVLATPDDMGFRANHKEEIKYRARQNVILELGMLFSKFGRSRVAIIKKEMSDFENPSDINGVLYIQYITSIFEIKAKLSKELNKHGYQIEEE